MKKTGREEGGKEGGEEREIDFIQIKIPKVVSFKDKMILFF